MPVHVLLAIPLLLFLVNNALAQANKGKQLPRTNIQLAGTVKEVGIGVFQFTDDGGELWLVKVEARPPDVRYTGSADGSFLRPGLFVRITSKLDRRGKTADSIADWTVFTPSAETPPGLKADAGRGADPTLFVDPKEDKKPKQKSLNDPTYEIAGRITKVTRAEITIDAAGTQVRAAPAEKLNVSLDLTDLSYLRPGDKVEMSGWHITGDKGRAWATRVTATAAASLTEASNKKGKAK